MVVDPGHIDDQPMPVLEILVAATVCLAKGMLKADEESNDQSAMIAKAEAQRLADLQIAKIQITMGQTRYLEISTPYDS
jgi:hypothetical protein